MAPSDSLPRLGLINHGGFFSPYYLFELLARQHGDELDPEGREANRRQLRRVFRKAEERFGAGSTPGEAWTAWHRELLEALGFSSDVLRRLSMGVDTARHDTAPISHGAFLTQPATLFDESGEKRVETPLVFVDCHGFGADLDRGRYPTGNGITEEPIARAIEFALDHNETRWAIVLAGSELRLYRKGGSVARQYLQVNFPALFDADRADEWTAFWGLLRYWAFVPGDDGKCLLDRVLEESQRHASRIADDLRENVVIAVEAIIQGIIDDPSNKSLISNLKSQNDGLKQLFEETLYFLYRLLFILYAESRDLLPVGESLVYRDTYSLEHLRDLAERPLHRDEGDRTYFADTIRALFRMLQDGFPPPGSALNPGFSIDPFNGQLFDPRRTALLDRCRIPDRALHAAIAELSLSRPRRRSDRRERFSYADLGVDQLGSIYEGLLVYEPAIVAEETVLAKVKNEARWVTRAQAEENELDVIPGDDGFPVVKRPGQFILRLWGGRRKGSGSYYTPQEITSFLVKEALEPLVTPIIAGCAERDDKGHAKRHADEILELKACDPAMGSGAFLIQACRYLAEAYGRARIAEGLDEDARLSAGEFSSYKRLAAERCLYGVDLNPMAVELAKVSLWLETLARGKPLDFLDAHLRCGNSLIGAPLRDAEGKFSIERLLAIPDEALKEVSKEATKEEKAVARERVKRNKEEVKRLKPQKAGQLLMDWGAISLMAIESALNDYLRQRAAFERSDADLPPAEAVALIHEKEQAFEYLQTDPESAYLKLRQLCDLWCAVWFWPRASDRDETSPGARYLPPPTTQTFLELAAALLGTDPGSLSDDEREAYWQTVKHVWREGRFFHWELEFPEVWREKNGKPKKHGGFDAVVGNPPWETVKPNSKEFWSNYDPLFRDLPKQEALRRAEELRKEEAIDAAWLKYSGTLERTNHHFRIAELYNSQGQGDLNTFKLFTERAYQLARDGGSFALILPSSVSTDLGCTALRELLLSRCQLSYFYALVNEKFIFPAVHHAFRFIFLGACKGGETTSFRALFRLNPQNAMELPELTNAFQKDGRDSLQVDIDMIRRFAPDSISFMEFKSQREIEVAKRVFGKHRLLGEIAGSESALNFSRELHMTDDSDLFHGTNTGFPLYEGKMFWQFDHSVQKSRYWVQYTQAKERLTEFPSFGFACDNYRLCIRDVTGSTSERTAIASILPPKVFLGHTICYSLGHSTNLHVALSVLNSLVIDFIVRMKVKNHLSLFYLAQLPVPELSQDHAHFDRLISRATRLTCTTPEFADLWRGVMGEKWKPGDSATDPRERAQLRAEIDALAADLYGLSESDFTYILSTFPLLDRDQPPLLGEPKSYITRDLALLELFKLRGATPPDDIVAFHREAGVDIAAITGPVRDLRERVQQALGLGAVGYVPSGRGGQEEEADEEEGSNESEE